jgi:uncharacterized protein YbbC (DUF1343 family)
MSSFMFNNRFLLVLCLFFQCFTVVLEGGVSVGLERMFEKKEIVNLVKGKRLGLITNHTAITKEGISSIDVLKDSEKKYNFKLVALFAPEHGLKGDHYAEKAVSNEISRGGIPIFSLYGKTRRPTKAMLKGIDLLVYDIQDIGSRSYTYISTLFYVMEEAAKEGVDVLVLDRPNPINGLTVDGPMLDPGVRSYVGYINVPYCHGMTICELAHFFNTEYRVGCKLHIVPMEGWKRSMTFKDTGLPWKPTSPHIPEPDSPVFYPTTGILGELQLVNIGVGYTLPFKLVGAPWIDAESFAKHLNGQKFPGVSFHPFYFRPFFGRFARQNCQGVLIQVDDPKAFLPVSTQYLIIGILKSLYPKQFSEALAASKDRRKMFKKVNGTDKVYEIIQKERYIVWKLRDLHKTERERFLQRRKQFLIRSYT